MGQEEFDKQAHARSEVIINFLIKGRHTDGLYGWACRMIGASEKKVSSRADELINDLLLRSVTALAEKQIKNGEPVPEFRNNDLLAQVRTEMMIYYNTHKDEYVIDTKAQTKRR